MLSGFAVAADALPAGEQVVSGAVAIGTSGASTTITQNSDKAIVNWSGFSVGTGNTVNFVQPNASSSILNRVTGNASSTIAGAITANGQVYLINPNGIAITPTGSVKVGGGFVASTLDISNEDFLKGQYNFSGSGASAPVSNEGVITVGRGGYAALIGGTVKNDGLIAVPMGKVGLGSGEQATLDLSGDGFLQVAVPTKVGAEGKGAMIENGGTISAEGGTVVMRAATARDAARHAVNLSGVVEANSVSGSDGAIVIGGGDGGSVAVSGKVLAKSTTGKGGKITVTGKSVALKGATVDASGKTGGGTVKIGGDYQGKGTTQRAETTSIDAASVIKTDATENGNGGTIVVWSDNLTSYSGLVTAIGAGTGAGGAVEISGKALLDFEGTVDTHSESGVFGNLLLDPYNLTISSAASSGMSGYTSNANDSVLNASVLTSALASTSVTVQTGSGGAQAGNITVAAPLTWNANTVLTLNASGSIAINKDITASGTSGGLALVYGTDYSLNNGARINLPGSSSTLSIGGVSYSLIRNVNDLQGMSLSGNYAVATDIDASATASWNSGAGFASIGDSTAFSGTFSGLGHNIDGLTINRSGSNFIGLFGATSSASLRDVTLSNVSVSGQARVGALVGQADTTLLTNIHVTGSVTGSQEAGGIAGWFVDSTLSNASSAASVTVSANGAGGLVGYALYTDTISDSYSTGAVTAASNAGGLVGQGLGGPLTLTNVYASGRATGASNAGGLLGLMDSGSVTLTNAYWDSNSTGQSAAVAALSAATVTGTSIDDSSAPRTQSSYSGLDFTNTWVMIDGETRPMLRSDYSTVIATPAALQLMSLDLSATYQMSAGVDMTGALAVGSNGYYGGLWGTSGFVPIGTSSTPFTGILNGQSYTITGLTINRGSSDYVGLFGFTDGASIDNLTLSGGSIIGNDNVGALTGYMLGGSIDTTSSSATISGLSSGEVNTGGLIGTVDGGLLSATSVSGAVTGAGYDVGGLVGFLTNGGTITQSYATGAVTGTSAGYGYIGGLVGSNGYTGNNGGTISQSYASGTVTSSSGPTGGLVGHNNGTITDSYATGRVIGLGAAGNVGGFVGVNFTSGTITNAYATGYVTGASNVGGFAGYNNNTSSSITNVYWDVQTTGQSVGIAGGTTGGATARTTAQLQGSLPAGFSSSLWGTGTGLYPYLQWRYSTTPSAVSGVAYSDAGTTTLAGATVTAVSSGTSLGSDVTGANGYYYVLLPGSTIGSSGVLAYLDNGTIKGAAFSDVGGTNGVQNVAIYGTAAHVITGQSTLTATRTNYLATRGRYADTDLSFLSSSSFAPLTTTAGYDVYLNTTGNYTLNTNLGSSGLLVVDSGGTLAVSGALTLSAAGALTIADALSWSDGSSLTLSSASGDINLAGAVSAPIGTLNLSTTGTASTSAGVNVGAFRLTSGTWSQIAATLPAFAASNFVLGSGTTFLRTTGGDGSVATPYQISDVYGLQGVGSSSLLSQNFMLTADIDASVTSGWNSGAGFSPIGTSTGNFLGAFDGDGHTISGLQVSTSTSAGLFGFIGTGGTVSNMSVAGDVSGVIAGVLAANNFGTVSNVTTSGTATNVTATNTGTGFLGGLVGYQSSGTILDSSSSVTVVNSQPHVSAGGLVGASNDGTASVTNSFATGSVTSNTATDTVIGGLIGGSYRSISGSYATGTVSGGTWSGGLVGVASGSISNSFATGSVSGTDYVGGLVGQNSAAITNTYATGTVLGGIYSGGFVGYNGSAISNSYSTGTVTGGTFQGGFIGYQSAGTLTADFWNTATSGTSLGISAGSLTGVTGLTTVQMSSLSTFTGAGWSIDDTGGTSSVWRIYDGDTMPLLRSFMTGLTVTGGNGSKTYDGSAASSSVGTLVYGPSAYTSSLVLGGAAYTASSANAGTYSGANLELSGLYSSQLGYDITFVSGSLLIDKAALTATASNDAKTYSGIAYSGGNGVSYTGFVGGDSSSAVGGTLTFGGTSQGAVNAGTYSITASGLTSTNYAINYVPGTLTVAAAPLTVTANNANRTYDGAAYSGGNGVAYSGFIGSDSTMSLGGTLTYGGTGQGAVNAGTYSITASGLTSNNYAINYVSGTLTVAAAPLTVTANNATRTYDGAAFSGGNGVTYSGFVGSDSVASLGGTLTYGGTAQGAVNVGTYSIKPFGLTSSNYTIAYVDGDLTIAGGASVLASPSVVFNSNPQTNPVFQFDTVYTDFTRIPVYRKQEVQYAANEGSSDKSDVTIQNLQFSGAVCVLGPNVTNSCGR